jgi:transcriptional regulator with XRE-family HTH domain
MPNEFDPQVAAGFGRNLRAIRKKRGISQEELARGTGLHRTAIGFLEKGERVPRLDTLLHLAKALEIDPADLLADVEPSPIPKTGPVR